MTAIDRDRLRRLADAATPGPWVMDDDSRGLVGPWIDGVSEEGTAREIADCTWTDEADAEFITAARGAVPALLDALTRAEAQSETRRQQTAYWQERAEHLEVTEEQLLLRNRNLLDAHRKANARIQAVEIEMERHEKHLGLDPLIPANRIRRALDAP